MLGISVSFFASAAETISIISPYSYSHSGTPAMQVIVEQANQIQNQYKFLLEFKPGGEQLIAVKALEESPNNRLAIIAPKFVEHVSSKKLNANDYIPVHALGDACWAVITNVGNDKIGVASLQGQKELVVGGVGIGNAAHLTSLQLAEKYKFKVRYVPFKSNFDALVLMVSDNSVNMVLDRVNSFNQLKDKNPNIKMLAMSCPTRHTDAANLKTLAEQGITAPFVFNITVSHKGMDQARRAELSKILNDATLKVGAAEIQRLSDMSPPVFNGVDINIYYQHSFDLVNHLLLKHQENIKP